jgi:hypothetical protein
VRPLRAWLVTTHSGGSGTPPERHYDRSARSSLDWDRATTSQEARPGVGAELGSVSKPPVERREAWCLDRKRRRRASQARRYRLRLPALRSPRRIEGQEEYRRARALQKIGTMLRVSIYVVIASAQREAIPCFGHRTNQMEIASSRCALLAMTSGAASSRLQFGIPIEIVEPAFVQIIRRE